MHDIEALAIWFWAVSTGLMLTILMPYLVSDPSRRSRLHDEWPDEPLPNAYDEQRGALARSGTQANLSLLAMPSARDIPRAAPDHRARDQDQAA